MRAITRLLPALALSALLAGAAGAQGFGRPGQGFRMGGGAMLGNSMLHVWGGWVGLLCGALAMYGSFALVTNATYGREVVPIGSR